MNAIFVFKCSRDDYPDRLKPSGSLHLVFQIVRIYVVRKRSKHGDEEEQYFWEGIIILGEPSKMDYLYLPE